MEDHKFLREYIKILRVISSQLETGVPKSILAWSSEVAILIDMELHHQKERYFIDNFIDRIIEEQGDWVSEISGSSFTTIVEEHKELEELLSNLQGGLEEYFSSEDDDLKKIREDIHATLVVEEEDLKRSLPELKSKIGDYLTCKKEGSRSIQNVINQYCTLLESHLEREEKSFFPFALRYLTKKDLNSLIKRFREVHRDVGEEQIVKHIKEITMLQGVLEGGGGPSKNPY